MIATSRPSSSRCASSEESTIGTPSTDCVNSTLCHAFARTPRSLTRRSAMSERSTPKASAWSGEVVTRGADRIRARGARRGSRPAGRGSAPPPLVSSTERRPWPAQVVLELVARVAHLGRHLGRGCPRRPVAVALGVGGTCRTRRRAGADGQRPYCQPRRPRQPLDAPRIRAASLQRLFRGAAPPRSAPVPSRERNRAAAVGASSSRLLLNMTCTSPALSASARARLADLLELAVLVAPAEALRHGLPAEIALGVAPVDADVGEVVAGGGVYRRHDRHVVSRRRVHADERHPTLGKPSQRRVDAVLGHPGTVPQLDRHGPRAQPRRRGCRAPRARSPGLEGGVICTRTRRACRPRPVAWSPRPAARPASPRAPR